MSKARDIELEQIFSYGIDRKARKIYFGTEEVEEGDGHGDVAWLSVENAVKGLQTLIRDSSTRPIEFHVYSWGGDVYAMLRMVDEIEACPCQVRFFGGGRIASSMTWIMSVCDERNLHKNTTIMLHDGSDGIDGKHTDVQIDAKHGQDLQDRLNQIFADNSHMSVEFWEDILQRDLFITAEECIALGLADKIIQPKKRGNLRRSRIAIQSKEVDTREMRGLVNSLYKRVNRKKVRSIEITAPRKEICDPQVYIEEPMPNPETLKEPPVELVKAETPDPEPLKKSDSE